MRFLLAFVLVLCLAVFLTEAKRRDKIRPKEDWRQKKMHSKLSRHPWKEMERKHNGSDKSDKVYNVKKHMKSQKKKNKGTKHYKFGHGDMSWVTVIDDYECQEKCERGEVCIKGPIDSRHFCVHKKDLKKSVKLFHKYQKKEMKAWNKFKKQKYNQGDEMEQWKDKFALLKKEHMKRLDNEGFDDFDMDMDFEKMEKRMKHAMGKQMKLQMGKYRKPIDEDNYLEKSLLDAKTDSRLSVPFAPIEAGSAEGCETSQFSQMRGRLMGWFHLLHGQDHLARQAHGGSLKHFYKHVSVKKELREHNGDRCECLKSAMWQFHQMDKNTDDHLSPDELLVMEQDSLEPCMKPYLTSCDRNADSKLSSDEWCCCFSNIVAPCFKKLDELRMSGDTESYVPACDKEGYYMREQCGGKSEKEVSCWCVDYNGNEFKGTRRNGRAHCHKLALRAIESEKSVMP